MTNKSSSSGAPGIDEDLLIRYYAGACSDAERAEVDARLAASGREQLFSQAFRQEFDRTDNSHERARVESAIEAWRARYPADLGEAPVAASSVQPQAQPQPRARVATSGRRWAMWSAGVMLSATALVLFLMPSVRGRWFPSDSPGIEYASQQGERMVVTLPDSSRLVLAPSTYARYHQSANGARNVTLRGQGYFVVAHAAASPFTVRTGKVQTRVLGTAFDVRHYPTDSVVHLAVTEGKIETRGTGGKPVVLSQGDVAVVGDSVLAHRDNAAVSASTMWMQGKLVFTRAPVKDVLAAFTRWYGYEFRVDSALQTYRVTMMASLDRPAVALGALKELLDATMQVRGDTVTLTKRPTSAPGRSVPAGNVRDQFVPQREVGK